MSGGDGERIEVRQEPGGSWRWRFVCIGSDGEVMEIPSNSTKPSCDDAVSAAQTAYPGLPVLVEESPTGEAAHGPAGRLRWTAVALVAVALAAVHPRRWTVLAAIASLAARRAIRRRTDRGSS